MKLTYGKTKQLAFSNEKDYYTALGIFCNTSAFSISYEPNKKTGSYADAYRMRKLTTAKKLPPALESAIKSGNRINCNEYVENLIQEHHFTQNGVEISGVLENVISTVPSQYWGDFLAGYNNYVSNITTKTKVVLYPVEDLGTANRVIKEVAIPKRKASQPPRANTSTKRSKMDYIKSQIANTKIGELGEKLVFKHEQEKLKTLAKKDSKFAMLIPEWVALEDDGAGYDIKSYNENGDEIFIEVKATTGSKFTPFYISANELEFSKTHAGNYYLYRLFSINTTAEVAYFILSGDISLSTEIEISETEYIAKLKS